MWPLPHFLKRRGGTASWFSILSVLQLEGFTSQSRPQSPRQGLHSDVICSQFHGGRCQSIKRGDLWTVPHPTHCSFQTETLREAFVWKVGRLTLACPLPPAAGLNSHWQVSLPGRPALRGRLPLWPHLEAMAGSRSGLESSWPWPQPSPALPSPPFHVLFLNFLRMISTPGFLVFLLKPQSYSFSFNDSGKNSARALEDSGASRMKRTQLCMPEHWFGFSLIESLRLRDKQGHSFSFFPCVNEATHRFQMHRGRSEEKPSRAI